MSRSEADIVVFVCNWDGLSAAEAAAQQGLHYPASVRVVRVTCLSRIDQGLILKAFEVGAAGVMLLGCEPGKCQFDIDSELVVRECERARSLLRLLGMNEERLVLAHAARGDGREFVRRVTSFISELEQTQPGVSAGA
jgi:F420-non-reducing hydrogenase iron-sulfur subunit